MTVTAMPNNDTKEPKKGSRRNLVIISVLLLVILGGGAYMVLKPKHVAGGHAKPTPPSPGAVLPLSSLQINLASGHYLSLGLTLQLTKKAPADIDGSQAEDAAINEYTGLSLQQVTTSAERQALKATLLKTLEKDYPDSVMAVYYTAFVTQ